jgi:thioredoxin-dependent peroxiredoxin
MRTEHLQTELPNVAAGPKHVSIAALGEESRFVVLLLMQGAGSGSCRQHAREVAAESEAFHRRNAAVVAIVPGSAPKVRSWRRLVDPSFPVVADRDGDLADSFGQAAKYGRLGRFVGSISRPPIAIVLDFEDDPPSIAFRYEGETSFDRPAPADLLAAIDERSA